MKINIAYLFAGLLAVTLLSCSDDTEPLIMQEEESALMLDYQTALDAQRALLPSTSQQMDGEQPDKKGQKGRDHRDWYDVFENSRIKDFEKDITQLELGDLYAIDRDGVNPYIFKFYFPEELRDRAKKFEGVRAWVYLCCYGMGTVKKCFSTDCFSFDDYFTIPIYEMNNWYYFKIYFYNGYEELSYDERTKAAHKEVAFKDMVIIKEWH